MISGYMPNEIVAPWISSYRAIYYKHAPIRHCDRERPKGAWREAIYAWDCFVALRQAQGSLQ